MGTLPQKNPMMMDWTKLIYQQMKNKMMMILITVVMKMNWVLMSVTTPAKILIEHTHPGFDHHRLHYKKSHVCKIDEKDE